MAFRRDKTLAAAERYAARGQHAKAAKEYQAIVDNDPTDLRVWLLLADSLTRAGRKSDAVDRYLTVARHYAQQEQPQKALAVYRQVLALEPQRLDVQLQCAKLFRELGRISDAVVVFERIAQSTLAAGNAQEAIRLYQTVIELDPTSPSKRVRLAELYSRESMTEEAVEQFTRCADLLLEQGRREDYVKVGERLLFHHPERPDVLRNLSRVYIELGESRRALIKLNTLLQAEPTDVEGLELLGETFLALGKLGKAVSVMVELARVQSERGREGRAIARRVLRKALQWDLHDPQLRAMLAAVGEDSSHDRASPNSRETAVDDQGSVSIAAADLSIDVSSSRSAAFPLDEEELEELDVEELEELEVEELVEFDELDEEDDTRVRTVPDALVEELGGIEYEAEQGDDRNAAESLENVVGELDEDVEKALAEVRVLIKYHLFEHALSHLESVIGHPGARREGLYLRAEVLRRLERPGEAADALAELAELIKRDEPAVAYEHAKAALELDSGHVAARSLAVSLAQHADAPAPGAHASVLAEDRSASDEVALDLFASTMGDAGDDDSPEPAPQDNTDSDDFAIAFESETPVSDGDPRDAAAGGNIAVEDRFGLDDDVPVQPGASAPSRGIVAPAVEPSSAFELDIDMELDDSAPVEDDSAPQPSDDPALVSSPPVAVLEPAPTPPRAPDASTRRSDYPDIGEEVEEIEFFLTQQLIEDARAAYSDLIAQHPGHPQLVALADQLSEEDAPASTPELSSSPTAPTGPLRDQESRPTSASPSPSVAAATVAGTALLEDDEDDEDAYVAAIFDQAEPSRAAAAPSGAGASAESLDEADASTRFDLGTAYHDMGLIDQAIREFEAAANDSRWRARSLVMVAKLQQQTGNTSTAIRTLQQGLDSAVTEDERTAANYELGVLYEQTGQAALAVAAFERVRVGFRDRDERLETLLG